MANLYNIQVEYLRIMDMIEENNGEINEEIQQALNQIYEEKNDLIDAICETIVNYEASIVAIKNETERLRNRIDNYNKKIETSKDQLVKVLKHFNMRSANKKSKGYAFSTPLFNGFTSTRESLDVDVLAFSEKFKPLVGEKSRFVNYAINSSFNSDDLAKINELQLVPVTDISPVIDKKALTQYLKDLRVAKQIDFNEDNSQIKVDPIAELAKLVSKESLVIK